MNKVLILGKSSNSDMNSKVSVYAIGFILIAAMSRLLPHPPNFTPIGAMALLGGAYLGRKYMKFILPIAALFLSDFILNNTIMREWYAETAGIVFFTRSMITVYISFAIMILFGSYILRKRNIKNIAIGTIGVSIIFFLITNFGVWVGSGMYPKNLSGLIACFAAAMPFFLNTILGNVFFVLLGFGLMQILEKKFNLAPAIS